MFSDQVSSTSLTRDDAGINKVQRYTPWGETRTDGGLETDHTYTGQIEDGSTGLRFYNARYQDPILGRFISPDTIVPSARDGQNYNRYSYVENNPVRYSDPSGHDACAGGGGGCGGVRGPGQGVFNPETGRRDADVRDQAHEAANPFRESPGDQDSPDTPKSNAVRHATLSALLAFDLDGESAWDLVESHERFIQQNELDTAIDRANNRKGIELGERARAQGLTVEELKASVLAEYDGGGLFCDREGAVAAC